MQANADDILADYPSCHRRAVLVPVGPLSCLSDHLRALDRHHDAAVSSLIPALSCRSCRPNAPFAEFVRLSRTSIADEMREEHRRRVLGE